jgi:hypothetical protein
MTAWSQVERNMCVIRATSCSGWMLGAMYNQHRCGACRHFKRNTYDILKRRALDRFKEENMIKITINNVETLPIPAYVMDPHVAPSTLDKVSTEISWGNSHSNNSRWQTGGTKMVLVLQSRPRVPTKRSVHQAAFIRARQTSCQWRGH